MKQKCTNIIKKCNTSNIISLLNLLFFIVCFNTLAFADEYLLFPDPIVWYTFDEGSGRFLYDHSGNDYHAEYSNDMDPSYDPGGWVNFETQHGFNVPKVEALNGLGDFTLAFDLSIYDINLNDTMMFYVNLIAHENINYRVGYDSEHDFFAVYNEWDSLNQVDYEIASTDFNEIVFVYDDTLVSVYFNHELIQDSIIVNDRLNSCVYNRLGYRFWGSMSEFKYFNQALTLTQIETVFHPDTIKPTIPINLILNAVGDRQISLDWSPAFDSIGVSGYIIYRNGEYYSVCDSNYFLDTNLITNATYNYKISSYDHSGNMSDFTDADTISVCSEIDVVHNSYEYAACPDDTVIIHTDIDDIDYLYQWHIQDGANWNVITDNLNYINTHSQELHITGFGHGALEGNYRLSIQNLCGTYSFNSIYVKESDQYSVWGTVLANKQIVDEGVVYLYNIDEAEPVMIDEFELFSGYYHFSNICPGNYIIKAIPQGNIAEEYAPRYYSDGYNINTAERLTVDRDISHVNIYLKPKALGINSTVAADIKFNPTVQDHFLQFNFDKRLTRNVNISIINSLGIKVESAELVSGKAQYAVNTSGLLSGLYIVVVSDEHDSYTTRKVVIP